MTPAAIYSSVIAYPDCNINSFVITFLRQKRGGTPPIFMCRWIHLGGNFHINPLSEREVDQGMDCN